MTTKERLHQLVDRLPESELATAEHVLAALARPDDAYRQAIANAPEDDESITAEDLAAIEEGWDDYESGASVSEEDLLKRLAQ